MQEPNLYESAFNCPHCGAYAKQDWYYGVGKRAYLSELESLMGDYSSTNANLNQKPRLDFARDRKGHQISNLNLATCAHCEEMTIWEGPNCIYPRPRPVEAPNSDMPLPVKAEYEEAASILHASPRGATALLRLALEKLCAELGHTGKINNSIGALVKEGLDPRIQRALDALRVIGNEAVHPGKLDIDDDKETARKLFTLLNLIVERMISHDKHIDSLYGMLTPDQLEGIENRDKDSKGG